MTVYSDDYIDTVGFMLEEKGMTESQIDAFFEHSGVRGMKWGVRRRGRVQRTVQVGSGKKGALDKARVYTMSNPADLLRTRSFRKSAGRKGARMVRRNERLAKKEAKFFKDVIPTLGAYRYTDLLPSVRGQKLTADKKNKLTKMSSGKEFAIVAGAIGAGILVKSISRSAVKVARG